MTKPISWLEEGNKAIERKDYYSALRAFSGALFRVRNDQESAGLLLKQSIVSLLERGLVHESTSLLGQYTKFYKENTLKEAFFGLSSSLGVFFQQGFVEEVQKPVENLISTIGDSNYSKLAEFLLEMLERYNLAQEEKIRISILSARLFLLSEDILGCKGVLNQLNTPDLTLGQRVKVVCYLSLLYLIEGIPSLANTLLEEETQSMGIIERRKFNRKFPIFVAREIVQSVKTSDPQRFFEVKTATDNKVPRNKFLTLLLQIIERDYYSASRPGLPFSLF